MYNINNTYWNHNGKYQRLVDGLSHRAPGHGYTSNVYVNIYLVMAHLYYDAYNNGGGNIQDSYAKDYHNRVEPYLGEKVDIKAFLDEKYEKMETTIDAVLEFIKDKNLDFPIYSFWCNHDMQAISNSEPVGELADKGYWFGATFGEPEEMNRYKETWCRKYKDLSGEFLRGAEHNGAEKSITINFRNVISEMENNDLRLCFVHSVLHDWAHSVSLEDNQGNLYRIEPFYDASYLNHLIEYGDVVRFDRIDDSLNKSIEAWEKRYMSASDVKKFIEREHLTVADNKGTLDDVIKSCEEMSRETKSSSQKNEYYKTSDGWFDFYVNRKTGEKKFKLGENDVEVEAKHDDFSRNSER